MYGKRPHKIYTVICWGEPERAPHKWYSCARILYYHILLWYVGHVKLYIPAMLSMDINAKYSIVHSHTIYLGHGPYISCSNLANCKFTLVLVLIKQATVPQAQKGGERERDRARRQLNSARTS